MFWIFLLIIFIIASVALLHIDDVSGERVLLAYRKIALLYIQSMQVLFSVCLMILTIILCRLSSVGNHFVVDYYILFIFSFLILIRLHTLKITGYPSIVFSTY